MSTKWFLLLVISFNISSLTFSQIEKSDNSSEIYFIQPLDSLRDELLEDAKKQLKDNYYIIYDDLYDMHGSAQNLFSVARLFGRGLDKVTCKLDNKSLKYYCLDKNAYIGRLFLDGFINLLFVNWLSTLQHEINGHGFRIREEGVHIKGYVLNPGLLGSAHVIYDFNDLSLYGKLLYSTGGPESNTIFSREAFRYGLQYDYYSHHYIISYFLKLDLPMYILGGTEVGSHYWENGYGDVVKYCMTFEELSDYTKLEAYQESKKGAYISLLDPSLLLSFYHYVKDYIIKGEALVQSPLINIRNIGILPFVDYHLSPYGFEYYLGSYLRVNEILFEPYYRWSYGHNHGESYGFGLYASNFLRYKRIKFNIFFDFWHQDFNLLYYDKDLTKYYQKINSAKIALVTHYNINRTLKAFGQIGYKGEGFLLGNPVDKGFSYKLAFGIYF